MKNLLLALVALLCLSSCLATSGDLQRIADKHAEGEAAIAAKQLEYAQGLASAEEVTQAIKDAWGANIREVEAVAESIKERGQGFDWEMLLAGALGAIPVAGGAVVGLNQHRNKTRAKALEEAA
jgi:hypothetical protein